MIPSGICFWLQIVKRYCMALSDKKYFFVLKVYEVKGRLGVSADDFTTHGRLVERATYLHVNESKMSRLLASIQATYQREMFR